MLSPHDASCSRIAWGAIAMVRPTEAQGRADGPHGTGASSPRCRFCAADLTTTFVDLGMSPLCQTHIDARAAARDGAVLSAARLRVRPSASWCSCRSSFRRRTSSPSTPTSRPTRRAGSSMRAATPTWRSSASASARRSKVMEIASNDGYLLQHFVAAGVPVLGIEPAANVAKVAVEKGVSRPTMRFFGRESAHAIAARTRPAATCCSATTCSPMCRTSTTSSPA